MLRIIGQTNIDFIGKRKISLFVSGILMILGIISVVGIFMGSANLGIDFTGGVLMRGSFENPVEVGELRAILSEAGYGDAQITEIHGENISPNSFLIKSKMVETESDSLLGDRLLTLIKQEMPDNEYVLDSIEDVGPSVGETLKSKARLAVILSLFGILVYIWIRFDFRFGVAATVATFHDVLAVMGIFFILQKEFTLLVVTALLTLVGYSLTDTVVVYDRIRENLKLFRKRSGFGTTINTSINEMLSRTIITSLTSIFVVSSLLILGGEVVRDFSIALLLGVIIGTYSSIFVASPIIVEWEKKAPKRVK